MGTSYQAVPPTDSFSAIASYYFGNQIQFVLQVNFDPRPDVLRELNRILRIWESTRLVSTLHLYSLDLLSPNDEDTQTSSATI